MSEPNKNLDLSLIISDRDLSLNVEEQRLLEADTTSVRSESAVSQPSTSNAQILPNNGGRRGNLSPNLIEAIEYFGGNAAQHQNLPPLNASGNDANLDRLFNPTVQPPNVSIESTSDDAVDDNSEISSEETSRPRRATVSAAAREQFKRKFANLRDSRKDTDESEVLKPKNLRKADLNIVGNLKDEKEYPRIPRGLSPERTTAETTAPFHLLNMSRSGRRFMYFVGDLPEPEAIAVKAEQFKITMLKATRIWLMNCGAGINVRAVNQVQLPEVYKEFLQSEDGKKYVAESENERNDYVTNIYHRNCADIYTLSHGIKAELHRKRNLRMANNLFVGPLLDEPFWRRHLPHWRAQRTFRTGYDRNGVLKPCFEYLLDKGDFRIVCNPTNTIKPESYVLTFDVERFDFIDMKTERHLFSA